LADKSAPCWWRRRPFLRPATTTDGPSALLSSHADGDFGILFNVTINITTDAWIGSRIGTHFGSRFDSKFDAYFDAGIDAGSGASTDAGTGVGLFVRDAGIVVDLVRGAAPTTAHPEAHALDLLRCLMDDSDFA